MTQGVRLDWSIVLRTGHPGLLQSLFQGPEPIVHNAEIPLCRFKMLPHSLAKLCTSDALPPSQNLVATPQDPIQISVLERCTRSHDLLQMEGPDSSSDWVQIMSLQSTCLPGAPYRLL
jgi:hypothetical protein